jgi:hypothetical protein
MEKYNIITGYYKGDNIMYSGHKKDEFFELWYTNTRKFTDNRIYVINIDGEFDTKKYTNLEVINLQENLGHIGDLLKNKDYEFSGWTLSILIGLLVCYNNKCDFLYKEQDCLFFGNMEEVYRQLEHKNCKSLAYKWSGWLEQSFFIVKHEFILTFVREWMNILEPDYDTLTEFKHQRITEKYPNDITFFDFGYGRERPFQIGENFFLQQITLDEMEVLKNNNLI